MSFHKGQRVRSLVDRPMDIQVGKGALGTVTDGQTSASGAITVRWDIFGDHQGSGFFAFKDELALVEHPDMTDADAVEQWLDREE